MRQQSIRNGLAATGAVLVLALFAFGALGFSGGASAVTSEYVRPGAAAAKPKAKAKPAVRKAVVTKKVVVAKKKAVVKKKAVAKPKKRR